jgi:hypothetical protein
MLESKFKPDVNLKNVLSAFDETTDTFEVKLAPYEFIIVDKNTREITQYGFTYLVIEWQEKGLLQY